ncbi:MAG: CDP-2,3-bis-(O-geranylgeranyl)-sn-glycerol synthase [Candidatus Bathyarchaeota archaeon]|nr:CDP-2,3-bis-(O-geranylgeranyl)-sn-glycerol synthase [Candidatus Bathyarchaeota archaeon]MDH5532786.1 CDP-2,3-bis-(O-geranylgeranyl)-sn-glycerol synthase [Candidatus Bathyarchaeota archaeon]
MSITLLDVAHALCFILPAYCANAAPVIFGGGTPIDFGKTFLDGKPIFGSHKTVRGFFAGLIVGTLVGFVQNAAVQFNVLFGFQFSVLLGFVLSLGALVGDLFDSFIKRRLGFPPGSLFIIADQLDFVVGALLFSFLVPPLPDLHIILIILIITPPIHLVTNFLAFRLGVKSTPW